MPEISLFIPAYNAENSLPDVLARISLDAWKMIRSVWIINDGSHDETQSVISNLNQKHRQIKCIQFKQNHGYGAAVKAGLLACRDENIDYAVCLHADGQYAPEFIPSFVKSAESGNLDILQGSRIAGGKALQGGMPLYKYYFGKTLNIIENMVFGLRLTDYHSGYLCYSRKALAQVPFMKLSNKFDFDLEVIASARKLGLKIGEIGIPTRYADEVSYLNPITYGLRVLRVLFRYRCGYYQKAQ
jgi:glycosyltransferase involved in cell wall biosynthesis